MGGNRCQCAGRRDGGDRASPSGYGDRTGPVDSRTTSSGTGAESGTGILASALANSFCAASEPMARIGLCSVVKVGNTWVAT